MIPNILSIAGSDSSGGAGIQADIKAISANGGFAMTAITALTAQNTCGVKAVELTPPAMVKAQLQAVGADVRIDAVKIGMLATTEIITTVADWLAANRPAHVVLDPVMVATSGDRLLDTRAVAALQQLCTHADLLTPNLDELAILAGSEPATSWTDVQEQATSVANTLHTRVLATGGHLRTEEGQSCDLLVSPASEPVWYTAPWIATTNTHGTGCSLSAAIASHVGAGANWEQAIRAAKTWLTQALRAADHLQVGCGSGPVHHFATLWEQRADG